MLIMLVFVLNFFAAGYGTSENTRKDSFTLALIGDIPRLGDKALEPDLLPFIRLRDEINAAQVSFVIHDGDFKSGSSPCSDEEFYRWYGLVNSFEAPFFFVNGDNEWTDCHTKKAGGYDPLERLEKLREIFYSKPLSLGKHTLKIERQSDNPGERRFSKYSDNFRWEFGNIMFIGLNVQGSNNNLGRTPEMDRDFRSVLEEHTLAFDGKPVVLVHGDSHYFRIDKPMKGTKSGRRIENFTRVETFGAPDVHWILATIDYENPNLFIFEQRIVKENIIDHEK